MRKLLAVVVLLAMASALAEAQKSRPQSRARREDPAATATAALLQVDRDFAKTGVAKNIDAFMSYLAEDVRFYSAGVMRTGVACSPPT